MDGAWKLVGRGPLIFGLIFIVAGFVLVLWSVILATKVDQA